MKTATDNQAIARTILPQLGGNRFLAMTGARSLTHGDASLNMRIGSNAGRVTHVHIALTHDDTYNVRFLRVRGHRVDEVAVVRDIYADQLRQVFEDVTGLRTSL